MKVFKSGDSLAIHIPNSTVEMLELQEGDEVDVVITKKRVSDPARARPEQAASTRLEVRSRRGKRTQPSVRSQSVSQEKLSSGARIDPPPGTMPPSTTSS
jgi:antitoxin component of MazEF toxin-antitoxin module